MFNQLIETEPQGTDVRNRKTYFIVSAVAMGTFLFAALIISLFAVDLNLGMGDVDMVELIAPVDVTDQKLPEPEMAPLVHKTQGGGSTASRQVDMARIDESPREVVAISTVPNSAKERPSLAIFQIGKFDTEQAGGSGSGRGNGSGPGDGDGTGLGDGTAAESDEPTPPPPPPVKKITPVKEKPIVRSMGVVNGYATSLPLPTIPAAAKAVNAAGTVQVQVLIDEQGNVISATAVSGNPLLRASSVDAARIARFIPATISGTPVKASGIINYHFAS